MSKTISFVATDKLAEWLEEESERRMTTISSTAQQLLAEKYRAEQSTSNDSEHDPNSEQSTSGNGHSRSEEMVEEEGASESQTPEVTSNTEDEGGDREVDTEGERSEEEEQSGSVQEVEETEPSVHEQVLAQHPDKWWETRSGSKNNYGVERPDGTRKYYKQKEAAAERVAVEYGAEGVEISTRRINQERSG